MARTWMMAAIAAGALGLAAVAAPAGRPAPAPGSVIGTWVNPRGSVRVATGDCGGKLCGWVVWANQEALADARDSGVPRLIGIELLQDYHATGAGRWQGQVYVPDMGRTFYSTIAQVDADRMRISGCVLGGLICKSQTWQRA